jgi:capsular polysaccharide biosynthesis protein
MYQFSTRVKRKLKSVFSKNVPYNLSLRPNGIYKNIDHYLASHPQSNSLKVYPSYFSVLDIEDDFFSKIAFDWPKEGKVPAAQVIAIRDGRIQTNAVEYVAIISEDNKVIGQLSYQHGEERLEEYSIFKQKFFKSPLKLKGTAFHILIGGAGDNNYFHWLFDALPRIHLLKKAGWFDSVDWFIVPSYKTNYQKASLKMVGVDEDKVIEGHENTHIQPDILIASTECRKHNHIPDWVCNFLRDSAFNTLSPSDFETPYPYLYISREDASYRQVENEPELINMLEKFGFKKVLLGPLSFEDQVKLFASAKMIVTPHGAGLANLVFCQKGTEVIELFSPDYISSLYYDLANKAELKYHYLICSSTQVPATFKEKIWQNMTVDVSQVRSKLEKVLESQKSI